VSQGKNEHGPIDSISLLDLLRYERATRIADRIGALGVVTILKRRTVANQVDSMQIVGDVQDKICVIVDDIIGLLLLVPNFQSYSNRSITRRHRWYSDEGSESTER